MISTRTGTLLTACLTATCATMGAAASSIGVNFTDSQDTPFSSATVAGAPGYAQANWNQFMTDWSGEAANDTLHANIVDSTGAPVTNLATINFDGQADRVHWDSANTWRSGSGNATADDTLMNGYLDDGMDNQPYVMFDLMYDGETGADGIVSYDVVVYIHGDVAAGAVGRYWIETFDPNDPGAAGTVITDQVAILANDYAGTYIQAGGGFAQTGAPTNVDVATGNYIVFTGITADAIRVRGAGNDDPEDAGRGPINAIQVVSNIPEPGSLALLALGGLALIRRRRG